MTVSEFRKQLYLLDQDYKNADDATKTKLHKKAELYELLLNLFWHKGKNEIESVLDRYFASITKILKMEGSK